MSYISHGVKTPRSFRKDITLDFAMIPLASPPPDACAPEEVFVNSAIAYMAKKPGIAEFYYNRGGDPTADERRLDSIPQGPLRLRLIIAHTTTITKSI